MYAVLCLLKCTPPCCGQAESHQHFPDAPSDIETSPFPQTQINPNHISPVSIGTAVFFNHFSKKCARFLSDILSPNVTFPFL